MKLRGTEMIKIPSLCWIPLYGTGKNSQECLVLTAVSTYEDLNIAKRKTDVAIKYLKNKIDIFEYKNNNPDNDNFSKAVIALKSYYEGKINIEELKIFVAKVAIDTRNSYQEFKEKMFKNILEDENFKKNKIIQCALSYAESVLPIFEKEFTAEKRHRKALEVAKDFLDEKINEEKLKNAYQLCYKASMDTFNYIINEYKGRGKLRETQNIFWYELKFYYAGKSIVNAVGSALGYNNYLDYAAQAVWEAALSNDSIKVEVAINHRYYHNLMKRQETQSSKVFKEVGK